MDWSWPVWLIIAIVCVLFELLSMDFIFIMLAGGTALAALAALAGWSGMAVWLVAIVGSALGLTLLRPKMVEHMQRGPNLLIGAAALIGAKAVVLEDVVANRPGRVKIGGDEWTALPADDVSTLSEGVEVEVVEVKGAIAYVERFGANPGLSGLGVKE